MWNSSTYISECHKDCEIGKYLKDCECMKSLVDDPIVTCDEIVDTPESATVNPSNGINYWIIDFVLSAIAYLLLLMIIVVKYYMKNGLRIVKMSSTKEINIKNHAYYFFDNIIPKILILIT